VLPSLSIIIPTKNRPSDLNLTVESVLRQSILPPQLIIVDQSDHDESQRRLEKLFAETPFPAGGKPRLCYFHDTRILGLTRARNRAMEFAQGDIWLFLDDDVVLEQDFLEELLAVYEQRSDVSGVSGIITNYRRPAWTYRLWSSVFVRGPFRDERQPIYWRADHLRREEPIRVRRFTGALMSFRAEAIRGYRFDENLRGVSDGEDAEFCARLGPEAILVIAPRARLKHKASPTGRTQEHWLRRFAQANFCLYHRNWKNVSRNHLHFAWLKVGLGLVALLASIRSGSLSPWHALREGAGEGARVGRLGPQADGKVIQVTAL
jgi:GT2 family glycosyltransferase